MQQSIRLDRTMIDRHRAAQIILSDLREDDPEMVEHTSRDQLVEILQPHVMEPDAAFVPIGHDSLPRLKAL